MEYGDCWNNVERNRHGGTTQQASEKEKELIEEETKNEYNPSVYYLESPTLVAAIQFCTAEDGLFH